MSIAKSDIVKSVAGRDAGSLFFVLATEGDFLLLADGKRRRVEYPKRKKAAGTLCRPVSTPGPLPRGSEAAKRVTNSELRKAIAALASGGNQDQEG